MRKYLFILLSVVAALGLWSCTNNNVPECRYHTQTLDLTVVQEDWQFDEDAQQFYYRFGDLKEITSAVYNYGNWTICREFNNGTKNAYQVALPMSTFMVDSLDNGGVAYYTQYIDYRLGIGYVDVQLTNSDYYYTYDAQGNRVNPEDMLFRLQLIY